MIVCQYVYHFPVASQPQHGFFTWPNALTWERFDAECHLKQSLGRDQLFLVVEVHSDGGASELSCQKHLFSLPPGRGQVLPTFSWCKIFAAPVHHVFFSKNTIWQTVVWKLENDPFSWKIFLLTMVMFNIHVCLQDSHRIIQQAWCNSCTKQASFTWTAPHARRCCTRWKKLDIELCPWRTILGESLIMAFRTRCRWCWARHCWHSRTQKVKEKKWMTMHDIQVWNLVL